MVFNKRDLAKAFSPNKVKRSGRRRLSGGAMLKPSTSGSTNAMGRSDGGSQANVRVIIRIRPHNERESRDNFKTVVKVVDEKMLIFDPKEEESPFFYQGVAQKGRDLLKKQNKEMQFIFDRVFDVGATNHDVYEESTKKIIGSLLEGYNCSVFVYGATGAGKTHTMLGKDGDPGITYLTMAELFAQIEAQANQRDFNLGVSYLEVYNENVQDLLRKSGPLHIREDGRSGIIVAGLNILSIKSAEELLALLAKGNKSRTQHPTDANAESSRSHAVFQVYVNITNKLDGQAKHVKLSMIDLAGSERASATGCKGARFKEGANINKSLLALGNCINNLADGLKHIPYRDSKLTRLLKDSLGGNCQTVMIANVSPSSMCFEDTYNTLRYANRAKKIKTNVKKNIVSCQMHVTGYIKMVEEQKKEIEMLKKKLLAYESGTVQASPSVGKFKPKDEPEEDLTKWNEKIRQLYEKKRYLNEKLLSLESTDKTLCCRIQYKKIADTRLRDFTKAIDASTPEKENGGKSRIDKSMNFFKGQREHIRIQMEAAWDELREVETELQELNSQVESKELQDKLEDKYAVQKIEVERSLTQQQLEHVRKISSLQQCEMRSLNTIVHTMSNMLQNYYNMMRGYGTMTDQMRQEFKNFLKSLEGVRGIKWADSSLTNQEEDFYSLACLSVQELANPIENDLPSLPVVYTDDEKQTNQTFDEASKEIPDSNNLTRVLDEKPECSATSEDEETAVNGSIDTDKLNNTFNLLENKAKKRVLTDKNLMASRPPVSKQMRKVATGTKPGAVGSKTSTQTTNTLGKENKAGSKSVMSAKSVAILNRLKTNRVQLLSPTSNETFNLEQSALTSKASKGKDKRRLANGSHPYSRPNPNQKSGSALPSSRVPW